VAFPQPCHAPILAYQRAVAVAVFLVGDDPRLDSGGFHRLKAPSIPNVQLPTLLVFFNGRNGLMMSNIIQKVWYDLNYRVSQNFKGRARSVILCKVSGAANRNSPM
jgi:hypothetical protein